MAPKERKLGNPKLILDKKISVAIIISLLIYGVLSIFPVLYGEQVIRPFSELGILSQNEEMGDYPTELSVDQKMELFLYLSNYEGIITYYRVLTKLGDSSLNVSDIMPYTGSVISYYDHVLLDKTNITIPIALNITKPGLNQRLVFELYKYDTEKNIFTYDGQWLQLWFNVTIPN
jgi:uncharacterized membrane protein